MQIKAENFLTQITIRAYVDESKQPYPVITRAIWECQACGLHSGVTIQSNPKELWHENDCEECGGDTFKLYKDDCTFTDLQELKCLVEDQFITVYLRGCQCKPEGYKRGTYTITGRLNIDINEYPYKYYVDQVTDIHKMRK